MCFSGISFYSQCFSNTYKSADLFTFLYLKIDLQKENRLPYWAAGCYFYCIGLSSINLESYANSASFAFMLVHWSFPFFYRNSGFAFTLVHWRKTFLSNLYWFSGRRVRYGGFHPVQNGWFCPVVWRCLLAFRRFVLINGNFRPFTGSTAVLQRGDPALHGRASNILSPVSPLSSFENWQASQNFCYHLGPLHLREDLPVASAGVVWRFCFLFLPLL